MSSTESPPNALFANFVMGLASATLIELGVVEDPATQKKHIQRDHARQHIEILAMLAEKTRGNLVPEEKELIERVLVDLKMQFAKGSK